ncbi:MAG: tRNA (N6-threonylcarbamoyladenosine(37)-N6)-methyltransferase TrmO [Candidatus Aegiribacteria sp.]|nr:tRNA (N6-threonylcarbamoyladenosine(37)-N6)-methyltransferase TrmO [Candidatus Aegiribacteria sp.]MBD3294354.1 tRNA (N6-threonylcarbamoyladenosine(37)-N6)-methyltransferase TrmO [Candidatus Fermentibacteria bacterium]
MQWQNMETIVYRPVGKVCSPYTEKAPRQPREDDERGEFFVEVLPEFAPALRDLDRFNYVIILFHIHRSRRYEGSTEAHPPMLDGRSVGLFASRSPHRPNPIGLDIARILRIRGRRIYTSGLSAIDGTPVVDIKPYIDNDSKRDTGVGFI